MNNDGESALISSVKSYQENKRINRDTFSFLIESGKADINLQDKSGQTALHYLSQEPEYMFELFVYVIQKEKTKTHDLLTDYQKPENSKQLQSLKLLLSNGANPNLQDNSGTTPLHNIVHRPSNEFISSIAEIIAESDHTDDNKTFLLDTLKLNYKSLHKDAATLLIEHGANPDIADNSDKNVMDELRENPDTQKLADMIYQDLKEYAAAHLEQNHRHGNLRGSNQKPDPSITQPVLSQNKDKVR